MGNVSGTPSSVGRLKSTGVQVSYADIIFAHNLSTSSMYLHLQILTIQYKITACKHLLQRA